MKIKKAAFRTAALVALAQALQGLKQDLYSDVADVLQSSLKDAVNKQTQVSALFA